MKILINNVDELRKGFAISAALLNLVGWVSLFAWIASDVIEVAAASGGAYVASYLARTAVRTIDSMENQRVAGEISAVISAIKHAEHRDSEISSDMIN